MLDRDLSMVDHSKSLVLNPTKTYNMLSFKDVKCYRRAAQFGLSFPFFSMLLIAMTSSLEVFIIQFAHFKV